MIEDYCEEIIHANTDIICSAIVLYNTEEVLTFMHSHISESSINFDKCQSIMWTLKNPRSI